ncbi:MAG: helix-turn-helix domain-containing protein [Terrimicrobiaceae bacterium]
MQPSPSTCLATTPLLRDFTKAYNRAVGLSLHFHEPGAFAVPQEPLVPAFCQVMAQRRKSCEHCVATHLALQSPEGPRTAVCFAGLTSSAVPVQRGGEVLGFLHTGHAYVDRPQQACGEPGRGCLLPGRGAALPGHRKTHACAGACRMTRQVGAMEYEGAVGLLAVFANQLASIHVPSQKKTTYPAIDHTVRKIRQDPTQSWALGDLARQAGMHPAYFSAKFHAHTGKTLTDFLAELRVERAKHLLAYTGLPISEIAFSSGFRSISQFNRVYKKLSGHPPRADHRN